MPKTPRTLKRKVDESSKYLKGGEFKGHADTANVTATDAPSLSETDWAQLSAKEREKKQRG